MHDQMTDAKVTQDYNVGDAIKLLAQESSRQQKLIEVLIEEVYRLRNDIFELDMTSLDVRQQLRSIRTNNEDDDILIDNPNIYPSSQ